VIDDEEDVRAVLSDALVAEGHQVTPVPTASEGLQALRQEPFDVVITDLGMPGMTGWEVGQAVRTIRPSTPVILITGWGEQLDPDERARSGIRAVLPKPFEMDQLFDLLHELCSTSDTQNY
jgi:CheY-like chemotaxis protein